mmetsp:Transcript_17466/g.36260  ORF Transcript_17466/g.36260 Transcript_17466/m.36260 type:complete len:504 (-) Transcript_17466:663-2174(-)
MSLGFVGLQLVGRGSMGLGNGWDPLVRWSVRGQCGRRRQEQGVKWMAVWGPDPSLGQSGKRTQDAPKVVRWAEAKMRAGTSNEEEFQRRRFIFFRTISFAGIFIAYTWYSITRSTFPFVSPLLSVNLKLSLQSLGLAASTFPMTYGFSKLLSGVLADAGSPRLVLATGLGLIGFANIGLSLAMSLATVTAWWGLNGLFQGLGAGACAKLLTSWFTPKERGFWWALWSASSNVGGVVAPLLVGWLASNYGWRAGAAVPGCLAVLVSLLVFSVVRNNPGSTSEIRTHSSDEGSKSRMPNREHWKEIFLDAILRNRSLWLMAFSYFFIYFVRSGLKSWLHFFFLQSQGCSAAQSAYRLSGMELGGIFGTFSSGIISDHLHGRRVPVIVGYLAGLGLSLFSLSTFSGVHPMLDFALVGLSGFFINGPQCLVGLLGAELADKRVIATTSGILGWISYGGAAASGLPLTWVVSRYGWRSYFDTLLFSTAAASISLLPLWNTHGREHTSA